MNIHRTTRVAVVAGLAAVLLAGCAAEDTDSPKPAAAPEKTGCELVTAGDLDAAAEGEDTGMVDRALGAADGSAGLASYTFGDCVASPAGVSVTIPDDLRSEIGSERAGNLPLDGFNLTAYELTDAALCAVNVDLNYSKQGLLEKGFTAQVALPPMTEEQIWDELLAEYKAEPVATAKKVTDKQGTSFMDTEWSKAVASNPASVLKEFEEWAKTTTNYVADQVVWREGGTQELVYDRAMALRIGVTGAEYTDADGTPLMAEGVESSPFSDEVVSVPLVAEHELTLDALDAERPAAGAYLDGRLTKFVVVTDCAEHVDDKDARYTLLLPIMGEHPDGDPAPFHTFASVDVAVTAAGEIAVDGEVEGYTYDDGAWASSPTAANR